MSVAFPGESAEHRTARNRLLEQEARLRRITEEVAARGTRNRLGPEAELLIGATVPGA